jgi:uncharacterized protein YdaU (DUF1376 family)
MARQPYIPIYIGDWEQDVNGLSIEAEGAWLKVIFKCWKNKGDFTATVDILARVCKVTPEKFASILLEWKLNNLCAIIEHGDGVITLTSRRMKRDIENSSKKAVAGSKGGKSAQAKSKQNKKSAKAESEAKHEYEYDNEIDNEIKIKEEVQEEKNVARETTDILSDDSLHQIFHESFMDILRMNYKHLNVDDQLQKFIIKVRGSPDDYRHRDTSGIRLAFQYQLRNSKPDKPDGTKGTNTNKQHNTGGVKNPTATSFGTL